MPRRADPHRVHQAKRLGVRTASATRSEWARRRPTCGSSSGSGEAETREIEPSARDYWQIGTGWILEQLAKR